ncbi:hypothetical protein [Agromyces humi]|uniref:hypothetical protein n=1 Tax=Agromyces humi TaxID=1766800 RepID=UPI0013598D22|nr:hypothetical protein [Agromyces humi]
MSARDRIFTLLVDGGVDDTEAAALAGTPKLLQPLGQKHRPITDATVNRFLAYRRSGSKLPFYAYAVSYDRGASLARSVETRGDPLRRMS